MRSYWLKRSRKQEKGFTIIELLIAVSVLSIGILGVASMQVMAIQGNHTASNITEATVLAQDRLEELKALAYDDTNLQDTDFDGDGGLGDFGFDNDPSTQADADYQDASDPKYTVYWNVSANSPISNNKSIRVVVTWPNQGGISQVSLNSIISQ